MTTTTERPIEDPQFGDLDGNGRIELQDALDVLTLYSQKLLSRKGSLSAQLFTAADVDGDGEITLDDALCVLTYYSSNTLLHKDISWYTITGNQNAPDSPKRKKN